MITLLTIHPQTKQRNELLIYRPEAEKLIETGLAFIESGTLDFEEGCTLMPRANLFDPFIAFSAIIYYLRCQQLANSKKQYLEPHI